MKKPTIVLGASDNPDRYSYRAVDFLQSIVQPVYPVGIKRGVVKGLEIFQRIDDPKIPKEIHTVSLYINPIIQKEWYKQIVELKPERVIFNPGTENAEFEEILEEHGIEFEEACTLVMVRTGVF